MEFIKENTTNLNRILNFWQSSFIILEDKTLRQSPKIFDYTKYLINDTNYKDININQINFIGENKIIIFKRFS